MYCSPTGLINALLCTCRLFFFIAASTTETYTLSLHDALPISRGPRWPGPPAAGSAPHRRGRGRPPGVRAWARRSEEHTSELQSRPHLVCRLLLEKKNSASVSWLGWTRLAGGASCCLERTVTGF